MNAVFHRHRVLLLSMTLILSASLLSSCAFDESAPLFNTEEPNTEPDTSRYLVVIEDNPDTVDFQCTSLYYTVAQNCFNRLVETEENENGEVEIMPSLARSYEVSDDGLSYTFHLEKGVRFSNGSPLTSSDVLYSLTRLLTHPDSCNRDIAEKIDGAIELERGETDTLKGFETLSDLDFVITLEEPFAAFLASMSMPGASIMDEETVTAAGDRFGLDPEYTIGTGSFILTEWDSERGMIMKANPDCWAGPPACEGIDLRFIDDEEEIRMMFENGELDLLDINDLNSSAEFFMHGDIYQDRLHKVQQVGTTYIALNSSMGPLQDVRVRKALQLSLNRQVLLDAACGGRGSLENGILSAGIRGYNENLAEIPYDPEAAKELLAEAGYPNGFTLTVGARSSSTALNLIVVRLASSMWERIGVQTKIQVMDESEFMRLRKSGSLACYAATWVADYDDPDNFFYTFFGTPENTRFRSLCYGNEEVIRRVRQARSIADDEARVREYQELEEIIVQEDAAWIPLFSQYRYYVSGTRLEGFHASWNGSVKNNYRLMSIHEE